MIFSSYVDRIQHGRIKRPYTSSHASRSQISTRYYLPINSNSNPNLKQVKTFCYQRMKNFSHIYDVIRAEDNTRKEGTFNTLSWMDGQMKSQYTDLLMELRTIEETIKTRSMVPSDQFEQTNQIIHTFSVQVASGLHVNT